MKRKYFISNALLATAGVMLRQNGAFGSEDRHTLPDGGRVVSANMDAPPAFCIFSKQLQWMNYADMAKAVADMGYDGIDLTVRANGHVLPENVSRDLPKAVEAAQKAGISIPMISTDISDAEGPHTKDVLETAQRLGIRYYRTNGLNYPKNIPVRETVENVRKKFAGLAALNSAYGLHSDYLNHSGEGFGSSLWDLWLSVRDLDPALVGSQFDIKHATIAGAFSWPVAFRLLLPWIKSMVMRDFVWKQQVQSLEVVPVPIGEGIVDFSKYLGLIRENNLRVPVSVMCDYDLGGAENGAAKLSVPGAKVLAAMKKDLDALRTMMDKAGL